MTAFVAPGAPGCCPLVTTTRSPLPSPAEVPGHAQRDVDELVERVGDVRDYRVDAPLERQLLCHERVVRERDDRIAWAVLRARAGRAARRGRHHDRGGIELVGELHGGVQDRRSRGAGVDVAAPGAVRC